MAKFGFLQTTESLTDGDLTIIETSTGAALYLGTDGTLNQSVVAPNDIGGNQLLLTNYANRLVDHGITPLAATNPFLGVFSDLDPSGAGAGMYVGVRHNQTLGQVFSGSGALELSSQSQVIYFGDGGETVPEYGFQGTAGGAIDVQLGRLGGAPYFGTKCDDSVEQAAMYVSDGLGNHVVFTNSVNKSKNHDHTLPGVPLTDPSLFLHSDVDPDTDNTQWLSLAHDQTNGVVQAGTGALQFRSATHSFLFAPENTYSGVDLRVNATAGGDPAIDFRLGTGVGVYLGADGTNVHSVIAPSDAAGNCLILTNSGNRSKDHGHGAAQTNPTLFIHSDTDPEAGDDTQWLSLTHDQAKVLITSGKGDIRLLPASNNLVLFAPGDKPNLQMGYGWGELPMLELVSDYGDEQSMLLVGSRTVGVSGGRGGNHLVLAGTYVGATHQRTVNFDHGFQTNPTLFIHSATDPTADNTEWMSLTHDQSHARIGTGVGDVRIAPASGVFRVNRAGTTYDHSFGCWTNIDTYTMSPNSATGMVLRADLAQDQLSLQTYTTTGKQFVLTDGDTSAGVDTAHAPCTDPTFFIHSARLPGIGAAGEFDWLSLVHNQTDAVLASGAGNIELNPASGYIKLTTLPGNFANDVAAAAGGVGLNEIYRNGSVLMIRAA